MDRKSNFSFNLLNFLWTISIFFHGISLCIVLWNQQYLLNDSVIYLTMAKNFQNYGVISQSFFEPIVPDFQRSPLYPLFISFLPIEFVLILQHVLILISGLILQKLSFIINPTSFYKYMGVLFTLMPYSINLPSLIMSESLFIFFLTLSGYFLILFAIHQKWNYLLFLAITLILCAYTRASILPFIIWFIFFVFFYSQNYLKTLVFTFTILLGIFPWILRNYSYTNQWFFTTASQISTFYGRIGGTVLALDKNINQDSYLKVYADKYISNDYPLHSIKKYPQNVINEENEQIQLPLTWIYIKQHFLMPFHAVIFHLRCIYQQMTGLSYGMSKFLYPNQYLAVCMALLQVFFIIGIYGLWIYLGFITSEKKNWIFWFLGIIFWLIIHNAAWADGRYRYVTDLWCILGIIFLSKLNTHKNDI